MSSMRIVPPNVPTTCQTSPFGRVTYGHAESTSGSAESSVFTVSISLLLAAPAAVVWSGGATVAHEPALARFGRHVTTRQVLALAGRTEHRHPIARHVARERHPGIAHEPAKRATIKCRRGRGKRGRVRHVHRSDLPSCSAEMHSATPIMNALAVSGGHAASSFTSTLISTCTDALFVGALLSTRSVFSVTVSI